MFPMQERTLTSLFKEKPVHNAVRCFSYEESESCLSDVRSGSYCCCFLTGITRV